MNTPQSSPHTTAFIDPLVSRCVDVSAIAEIAMGRADTSAVGGPHLALLGADALELDLADPAQRSFGDYELVEKIGEGGMGVVYRAHQSSLDRDVAVKLLAAGPWASREFIERFQREAQNAARMQHPNIVAIHEVGSHDELHFFSMRLVQGGSLATLLQREGKLDPRRAATLLRTIAEAVDYAHRLGVLHLDLKPANVLLDDNGNPHVADFGLARRLEQGLAADNHEISGTPSYMAPEQAVAGAQKITPATDVWGLGAIGYELVTGQPPFLANSAQNTLKLVASAPLRKPRELEPNLPRDLAAIVEKCMARDTTVRYASARELADDLGRFLAGYTVTARPLNAAQRAWRWARREPKLAATAVFAFAVLLIGLVATTEQWRHAKQNAALAQSNADLATHTLWNSRTVTAQKQMAQGDAYAALANAAANLREMQAHGDRNDAALERLRIGTVLANAPQLIDAIPTGKQQITALAISPDGKSVAAATSGRTVRLIDVASGRQRWQVEVAPNSFGMTAMDLNQYGLELHFSDDGRRLIGHISGNGPSNGTNPVLDPHTIDSVLIDVDAGKVVEPPPQFADFLAVSFSADGRYALLFDKHGGIQRWHTLPWAADGDLVRFVGNVAGSSNGVQLQGEALLTDDGAMMVLADTSKLGFRSFDAQHMRLRQTLHLTTDQDRATAWALRHDGRQLAIGTNSGQLAVWNLETGKTTWLRARFNGWISRLRYSADDSRLLAVSNEPSEMRVFDARSLDPVVTPVMLAGDTDPGSVSDAEFGPDAATALTRHSNTNAIVWRLPEPGFPLSAPVAAAPPMVATDACFALARDAHSHLMATSDNDQLKLWRVRWTPYIGGTAAPMVSDTLRFDGRHLVGVDGDDASVFDVANGQTIGKTIALPEAPTFAGLDGSGTRLIAIAGRELSCWNWQDGTPCWPAIALPDSPLRLGLAANAPMLAVSTGSNRDRKFFEHVRVIDLASGKQRGEPIDIRGPLGALRLSDNGHRLLVFEHSNTIADDADVLRVIDTARAAIVLNLLHKDKTPAHIIDARFAGDGSIWSYSGPTEWGDGPDSKVWHWSADGKLVGKSTSIEGELDILPLPQGRGVIETGSATVFDGAGVATKTLAVADSKNRVNTAALSPDGKLIAVANLDGVTLLDIDRNQRLVPDFKLALPHHDVVQQLAFAPDGSRLIGRTMSGHWLAWRIVADTRPVAQIDEDLRLRDFTHRDQAVPLLSAEQRQRLRAADPGPTPEPTIAEPVNAGVAAPVPDPRYEPLNLDAIANVDPRKPMNRASRVPPQPQSLPTLPRALQRYDGVDFLLGRAVQLSGTPRNSLNTEFPAQSSPLHIAPQRIAAVDLLTFQFMANVVGEAGALRLHFADGGEYDLPILNGRDSETIFDIHEMEQPGKPRLGWLGNYATAMHGYGLADSGEAAAVASDVVRLENPEPNRPVASISLAAPPAASPGLLFLALTLEPVKTSSIHP